MATMRLNSILVLALLGMLPVAFLATRPGFQNAAFIYTVFFVIIGGAYLFRILPNLPRVLGLFPGLIWGVGAGLAFIFLNTANRNFTIGTPFAQTEDFLVTVIAAPIFETFLFTILGTILFTIIFKNFHIAAIAQAIVFSIFHFTFYGETLQQVTTPFIGAFIFGWAMAYLWKHSKSIMAVVIAHLIANFYLISQFAFAIGGF